MTTDTAGKRVLLVLALLVATGVALRVVAAVAWWPIITSLADSWPYANHAAADPFADPQHPAGYSLVLALGGLLTRNVAAFGIAQNLIGIASALLLFAGVRRLCGSPWPGLVGAAVILLGADQIYLERTIMSETLFTLLLTASIYATARAMESPERWHPWPLVAGILVALAEIGRPAALFLAPLIALSLVLARPRPWLPRWRPVIGFLGPVCALLIAFGVANKISHDRFEIVPTPGWHLYARVGPIADCTQFDPPQGTEALCQHNALEDRLGPDWYLYAPKSPAARLFGSFGLTGGAGDAEVGAFARQVVLHEPRAYLESVWPDLKAYFFSDDYQWKLGRGTDLRRPARLDSGMDPRFRTRHRVGNGGIL